METSLIIHIHGRHSPPTRLLLTTPATTRMLQHPQSPTKILQQEPMLLPQPARYHSFGEGHVHARSVLGLEHGTEQKQLPRHETEDLQQNSERSKHAQKLAEPWLDTRMYLHSHTDSDTHSMHSAPPAAQQPRKDRESLQTHPMKKTSMLRPLLGRPDTIPSGKDTGKQARSSDLCRGASKTCNFLQHRSCRGRIYTEGARRHHTLKHGPSKINQKPADHYTRPYSPPDSTRWGAASPKKDMVAIRH
jgi:hypothetical protein